MKSTTRKTTMSKIRIKSRIRLSPTLNLDPALSPSPTPHLPPNLSLLRLTSIVLCLLFLTPAVRAQPPAADPPLVGRPANFSGVVGLYRISAAAPVKGPVRVEEPIDLEVQISGQGPEKHHPRQESLRLFPEDADRDFFIEPLPDKTEAHPDKQVWKFVYRLRPKHEDIQHIPGLKLVYFHPGRKKYQTAFADPIPITVSPPRPADAHIDPPKILRHPERLFRLRSGPHVFRGDAFEALFWPIVIAGFSLPPLLCLLWYWRWRRRHPGDAELSRRRRSRAGHKALLFLKSPGAPLDAARTASVLADYLRERFDLATPEPTIPEVDRLLRRLGAEKNLRHAWRQFLSQCDAQRFAPTKSPGPVHTAAADLIEKMESFGRSPWASAGSAAPTHGSITAGHGRAAPKAAAKRWLSILIAALALSGLGMGWWKKDEVRAQEVNDLKLTIAEFLLARAEQDFLQMGNVAQVFQSLTLQYSHPDLYHDMGNAYLLAGDVPYAIFAYRKGLQLAPADSDLRANLEYARAQVLYPPSGRGQPEDDPFPDWLPPLSRAVWVLLTIAFYAAAWVFLTRWLVTHRPPWPRPAFFLLLLSAAAGFGWWWHESVRALDSAQPLVVVGQDHTGQGIPFLRGNGDSYPPVPEVPALQRGMEARLLARRGDWLLIRLGTGEIGWVQGAQVLLDDPGVWPGPREGGRMRRMDAA